jgi:hypothetical protein
MTRLKLALALLAAPLSAQYTYYYTDPLTGVNTSNWTQNGDLTTGPSGLVNPDDYGGSLISTLTSPTQPDYEVRATLNLSASGGLYAIYVRASSGAFGYGNGTYYSFEITNPTFSGSNCSASLLLWKVNGPAALLGYTVIPCHNGMQVHAVVYGSALSYYQDGRVYLTAWDPDIPAGQPGIGGRDMPPGNSISEVDLGRHDTTPPSPVNAQTIGTSSFSDHVDAHWQGVVDDAGGIGVEGYWILRDGQTWYFASTPEFTDEAITPGSTHTYGIACQDWHGNWSPGTYFTVTAPPAGAIDPRRIGVHPLGNYWGAMGEQIDIRSGNLNYTLPLLKAQGRGGWSVPFALSYNSQQWRQDSAGTWLFGQDVGFGFGWQLMAGSITPYWSTYFTLDHYVFTDSTGTQYRLDVNNNGIWTSKQGVYVSYDATNQILHFPDGSFWVMGCTSGGTEIDAGAMYPTQMEDTNGNQVNITYLAGNGVPWNNSSARIQEIEDVRAVQTGNPPYTPSHYVTYSFTYNSDAIPHLTAITSHVPTGEGGWFYYAGG